MKTLNTKQAASFLHMHTTTLLAKVNAGEIPATKNAKCWVFIEEDLIQTMRSKYKIQQIKAEPTLFAVETLPTRTAKKAYYQALGIADSPQIHSPQPEPRSSASHAHAARQVAEGEAVGLVVKSANVSQSKTRMVQGA
jgi:hypothetical protein